MSSKRGGWIIAISCCIINCLLYGVIRLSGLLLVETVQAFHVSRASAAVPYSVSTSVRNLSGIFVGYLEHRFGLRPVIFAGCALASLGAAMCYFVTDIVWMTVCWGGIFGIGCGLATCLLPLAINQHFTKHRGTASGISYSGSYIGSFIFPPIVVKLLDVYGLPGTFLVISGAILNGLAFSMFFQSQPSKKAALIIQNPTESQVGTSKSNRKTSEFNVHRKSIFRRLLSHIKWICSRASEKSTNIFLISAVPLRDPFEISIPHSPVNKELGLLNLDVDALFYKDEFVTTDGKIDNNINKSGCKIENEHFQQSISLKSMKNKLRVKCKLLANKLRNILPIYVSNNHYRFGVQLQEKPTSYNSVQLLSIKPIDDSLCTKCCSGSNDLVTSNGGKDTLKYDTLSLTSALSSRRELNHLVQESALQCSRIENLDKSISKSNEICSCIQYRECTEPHKQIELPQSDSCCNVSDSYCNVSDSCCNANNTNTAHKANNSSDCSHFYDDCSPSIEVGFAKNSHLQSPVAKKVGRCCFGWFQMYADPMFLVITVTMALHTLVIVCMITIIEDYSKDIHVPCHSVHYVLMVLSTADLIGALTLGVITDKGIMSRRHFITLCFWGTGVTSITLAYVRKFPLLLTAIAVYGIFETGVIITFPLLIAQFIEAKKQAIALSSSNVLSSPTVLLVPLIIGFFRDRIGGCYSGVFYLLAITSFTSGLIWLVAPCIIEKRKQPPNLTQKSGA